MNVDIPLADGQVLRFPLEEQPQFQVTIPAGMREISINEIAAKAANLLTVDLEAEIIPFLPPAAPGRKVVTKRNAQGLAQEVTEYPPTPAPAEAAAEIRRKVVAALLPGLIAQFEPQVQKAVDEALA